MFSSCLGWKVPWPLFTARVVKLDPSKISFVSVPMRYLVLLKYYAVTDQSDLDNTRKYDDIECNYLTMTMTIIKRQTMKEILTFMSDFSWEKQLAINVRIS